MALAPGAREFLNSQRMCLYSSACAGRVTPFSCTVSWPAGAKVLPSSEYVTWLPGPVAEFATSVMCSGTGLLMVTLSDGCLQTLLAVTVHTTSVPGTTLPAGTRTLDFSPLSLTTSFSTAAVVLSSMQSLACANACAVNPQVMSATIAYRLCFRLF